MPQPPDKPDCDDIARAAKWILLVACLIKLTVQLVALPGYGWFRDEFYYLACADHLDWGYVDHPPLSVALLALVTGVFGDGIWVVRLLPALAGVATVYLTGRIALALGGGAIAVAIACLGAICAPVFLSLDHFYSMNAIELVVWPAAALVLLRALQDPNGRSRWWLVLGVVLGLGLLNKISVLWLGAGLAVGLAVSARGLLRTRGPWLAAAVALALFSPHIVWQLAHDWPTVEFMRNATGSKLVQVAFVDFALAQVEMMGYGAVFIWGAGLVWLTRADAARPYRVLAWIYLVVFAILVVNGASRAGYLAPAYTWLFAAGGVAIEALARDRRWVPWAVGAPAVVTAIVILPFALPVLSVERYVDYAQALGQAPTTEENKELSELPQWYADMHGWEALVDRVAEVYEGLPPADGDARIFVYNYGEAAALTRLGRARGLPLAISGHNNYWQWGPGPDTAVVIFIGGRGQRYREWFADVRAAGRTSCRWCMPYENGQTIWVARGEPDVLRRRWADLKHYD